MTDFRLRLLVHEIVSPCLKQETSGILARNLLIDKSSQSLSSSCIVLKCLPVSCENLVGRKDRSKKGFETEDEPVPTTFSRQEVFAICEVALLVVRVVTNKMASFLLDHQDSWWSMDVIGWIQRWLRNLSVVLLVKRVCEVVGKGVLHNEIPLLVDCARRSRPHGRSSRLLHFLRLAEARPLLLCICGALSTMKKGEIGWCF